MLKWLLGLTLAALLLLRPEAAANGAREAMYQWYYVVAPSLFPFMALLPMLTGEAAASVYDKLLGGLMRRIYRLPGASASALAVGMLAGSPAGCIAARRVRGLTRGDMQRLAIASCGLSPVFYISGIGAAMLNDPACGHILLRSQLATQLIMPLILMPFCRDRSPVNSTEHPDPTPPVSAILNVCGYMALFGALSAALGELLDHNIGRICLCIMDVTSGARIISALNIPLQYKMMALSMLTGFGGLCVIAQNTSAMREIVHPMAMLAGRIASGVVSACMTALQIREISVNVSVSPLHLSCFMACLLMIPGLFRLKKIYF